MSELKKIAVIILTFNEEDNLPACLQSLIGLDAEIFVVDSGSTDKTLQIAEHGGCNIYSHEFKNYGAQRNWCFDNLPIKSPWTLCLDADERLTHELVEEIKEVLGSKSAADGYMLRKRTIFMGHWIKYGGQYPSYHLRLFKTGLGRCEDREYDQHFIVSSKNLQKLKNDYIDVICNNLNVWSLRHVGWSESEVKELLSDKINLKKQVNAKVLGNPIERKRFLRKNIYQRSPLFLRAFLFWMYVYILRLGFLDKKPGLIFHTLRCFWWRFLVDAKMYEASMQTKRN